MQPKLVTQDASTTQPVVKVDDTPPSVVIKEEEPKISEIDDFLESKKIIDLVFYTNRRNLPSQWPTASSKRSPTQKSTDDG